MRIRTIKPEFWVDEKIGSLSIGARLLFIGCWSLADDEGILRWNISYILGSLFMYDNFELKDIEKWMTELVKSRLIIQYFEKKNKNSLAFITNWEKHQKIDRKQKTKFIHYKDIKQTKTVHYKDKKTQFDEYSSNDSLKLSNNTSTEREQGTGNREREMEQGISVRTRTRGDSPKSETSKKNITEKKIVFPWAGENFAKAWENWRDYKLREHKFRYKTEQSEQAALMELAQLSGGNESTAIEILKQSMAQGWKGLFELKKNSHNGQPKQAISDDAAAFRTIDRIFGNNPKPQS